MDDNGAQPAPDNGNAGAPPDGSALAAYKKGVDAAYKQVSAQPQGVGQTSAAWWSNTNAMTVSSAVLLFGLAVVGLSTFVARRATPGEALRLYGTIMVITMASFLVVAGYNNDQIAAPLGLLGTIVGYLLGRPTTPPPKDDDGNEGAGAGGGGGGGGGVAG